MSGALVSIATKWSARSQRRTAGEAACEATLTARGACSPARFRVEVVTSWFMPPSPINCDGCEPTAFPPARTRGAYTLSSFSAERALRSRCEDMVAMRTQIALVVTLFAGSGLPALAQRPAFNVMEASIDDVRAALESGQVTCQSLVRDYLARIDAYNTSGPGLNAVQTVNRRAVQDAERLDSLFRAPGPLGPLHCVPVLMKDQVETSDMPTMYGSVLFKGFIPTRDATIVTRLKNAGAVILAKTTMGEFASGYLGSAFGIVRNAYDQTRIASGSSGGTGAGVAASFATVGIGEDTGGSVRGPAAANNLVGLRPTTPLVSRHGMMPARPTTDTLGPITRSVKDAAVMLDVLAGYDVNDSITAEAVGRIPTTYTQSLDPAALRGARIGVIRQPLDPKVDPTSGAFLEVRAIIDRALADVRRLGAEVVDLSAIRDLAGRSARLYDENIYETEAATDAYLAMHPNAPVKSLREILLSGTVVPARARTLIGVLGHTTSDQGYLQLLLTKEELRREVFGRMADQRLDAVAYATFDYPPLRITADALTRRDTDLTGLGNNRRLSPVIGFPAITVPAGFTSDGLPIGLELMARPFAEHLLLRLAYAYEQGTHHRKPPSSTPALLPRASAR
jgi:amidase